MTLECPHFDTLKNAPAVDKQVRLGKLSSDGTVCDHLVPPRLDLISGQTVSCVGPYHPRCPKPSDVVFKPGSHRTGHPLTPLSFY